MKFMNLTAIRLPYFIVYAVSLIVSIIVFAFSWRNRSGKGLKAFAASILLEIIWIIGYLFELGAPTLDGKIFWDSVQFIGTLFVPIALLIFALQFTDRKFNLKRWVIALSILPAILQIIITLDLWPSLLHLNPRISIGLPFDDLSYDFGTLLLLALAYAYVVSLGYIAVLIAGLFKKNIFRSHLAIVTFGTLIPILGLILALTFGLKFGNQRDTSPLMFALGNIVIAWGIYQRRLFNVVPIAREILFTSMSNALIILDRNDRILDTNPIGRKVLGNLTNAELTGMHISLIHPELYQHFKNDVETYAEITTSAEEIYTFNITPLYNQRGLSIGRLVNANNVTMQKKIEADLLRANTENKLRAVRLHAIADVSQTISQIRDLKSLLPAITQQISSKFDFYHVGIFLISGDMKFAELHAANSEGGMRMLERGHRLEIGQVGVVGRVAQVGTPRVALDVGQDAIYFDNPDLPETHSEMALPLKVGTEIIGVLDVQSKQKNAFSTEDTDVFASLANQIAIAINNVRQIEATETALAEARSLSQDYVRKAWANLAAEKRQIGYRSINNIVSPLTHNQDIQSDDKIKTIEIPVQLRNETIGIIKVRMPEKEATKMTESDKTLLEVVGDRAALALESARLFEESQRKAERERNVGEIAASISAASEVEMILQTTVDELGQRIGSAKNITIFMTETNSKDNSGEEE